MSVRPTEPNPKPTRPNHPKSDTEKITHRLCYNTYPPTPAPSIRETTQQKNNGKRTQSRTLGSHPLKLEKRTESGMMSNGDVDDDDKINDVDEDRDED
ncbi:hypothetical protein VTJ04DRAFT_2962 [Mycothermus thermophilus]|uniref:uncharacterized protein n=1 Tax=Humicola insolens TaxID=85995 RepID=UPI003744A8B0